MRLMICIFLVFSSGACLLRAAEGHHVVLPPDSMETYTTVKARVIDGDTIPVIDLQPFHLFAPRYFTTRSAAMRYQRLVFNVRKVYPYARLAGIKLREYSEELEKMESDAQRRRAVRQIENEIREEFEGDLMKLTRTQGMILIKLIDRETTHTSYDLLRDFRGMVSAVFWQSLGRIFGYNLKTGYDPGGEDYLIEEIVLMIEAGVL
jgi:hypothetical protein